nr:hypothetical protein [Clostridia bacterium]
MSEFYNENPELLLDETLATPNMMWWLSGIMIVSGVAGGISGAQGDVSLLLLGVIVGCIAFLVGVVWLTYWLICRRMRLKMDTTRVWSHIPLTKDRSLNWADVRTAAVVSLKNMAYPSMIVLSVETPEVALTRKRMMWKNPKRGQELRFPLSDARRAVVEQQLGMQLPDIVL